MRRTLLLIAFMTGVLTPFPGVALPRDGSMAPDFALKSAAGRNVRLSELRGQVVLINFWASWCAPCREELPLLEKLQARYGAAGFALLAVNVDVERTNAQMLLKRLGVRLIPLYDVEKRVAALYDIDAMPATLIVGRDGRVRYVHRGFRKGYEEKYEQQVRELLKQ